MATIAELPGASASPSSPGPAPVAGDATNEKNDNWRFVESQPVRDDQIENAVKFLSHPKVKGSPVIYRRSFLEKKGLSREEIDEAFRRVPDQPSDTSPTTVPTTGPGVAVVTARHPQVGPGGQQITAHVAAKSPSWTQMLLALGVLTAAGAGAGVLTKNYFIPKLKEWILDIVSGNTKRGEPGKATKPSPVEEATNAAAAAAVAAATAATQMAGAMQYIAESKSEDRQRFDRMIRAIETQTQELKNTVAGMKDTVQNAEVTKYQRSVTNSFQSNGGGTEDYWKGQTNVVRSTSVAENQGVTTKPSNFGVASDSSAGFHNNGQQVKPLSPSPTNGVHAPHSQSYLDVMAMLERGEKLPGIREVNDKPPNPNQPPSNSRLQPKPKPWEKAAVEALPISPVVSADSGQSGRYNESWNVGSSSIVQPTVNTDLTIGPGPGSSSEPWWRKKSDVDAIFSSSSVKITEVDMATQVDIRTVQVGESISSSSSGGRTGWLPPAVPQPIYPGAEEAIRRPKSAAGLSGRSIPVPGESGSGSNASSSFSKDESPAEAELMSNSIQSNAELPVQRSEVPDEQDEEYLDRSLVDSTRSFKDVVQEGDN